jgi:hypothetical protein
MKLDIQIERIEIPPATPEQLAELKKWTIEPVQDLKIEPNLEFMEQFIREWMAQQ